MVETDRCNDRHQWLPHRIGRIQSSSQSCLKDCIIRMFFSKYHHSHSKQEFKIGRMSEASSAHLVYCCLNFFKCSQEFFVTDRLSVQTDPLIDLHQMRRSKKSCRLPICFQHGTQIGTYRSFAIGSRHMDNLLVPFWITKSS